MTRCMLSFRRGFECVLCHRKRIRHRMSIHSCGDCAATVSFVVRVSFPFADNECSNMIGNGNALFSEDNVIIPPAATVTTTNWCSLRAEISNLLVTSLPDLSLNRVR